MSGRNAFVRALPYLALIAASAYFFFASGHLEYDKQPGRLGPDAWPKGILALMILVCFVGVAKALHARPEAQSGEGMFGVRGKDDDAIVDEPSRTWLHLPILGCVYFAVYVPILGYVGFVLSTAALIAAFLHLGRFRNHFAIAACAVIGPLAFFYVFRAIAYVSLPLGKGPFLEASVWLMKLMGMA